MEPWRRCRSVSKRGAHAESQRPGGRGTQISYEGLSALHSEFQAIQESPLEKLTPVTWVCAVFFPTSLSKHLVNSFSLPCVSLILKFFFCAIVKHMASPEQRSLREKKLCRLLAAVLDCLPATTADSGMSLRAHLLCSVCDKIAFKCHLNPSPHS